MNTNPYKTNELLLLSIIVIAACSKPEANVPKGAIDLGLSVYWAECNLGAEKPEEDGDYYAWGEVETKFSFNYPNPNYKWGKYNAYTKYNMDDNKTVLDLEDDAAQVNLGGKWRMPTDKEWEELVIKCASTWTSQNGVEGIRFTAPNGNSLFLPAAGYKYAIVLKARGYVGYYWSSSRVDEGSSAYSVEFDFEDDILCFIHTNAKSRSDGLSIRPVSE